MSTFRVLVRQTRDGWVKIEAETAEEAMHLATERRTRDITWDDDCQDIDAMEAEELDDE